MTMLMIWLRIFLFPKKPKKIFTCLGILRSTLMDRYIAKNIENGTSLILAQHGGNYFQHKSHFNSLLEVKIADKYLSWGNIKKKNRAFWCYQKFKKKSKYWRQNYFRSENAQGL